MRIKAHNIYTSIPILDKILNKEHDLETCKKIQSITLEFSKIFKEIIGEAERMKKIYDEDKTLYYKEFEKLMNREFDISNVQKLDSKIVNDFLNEDEKNKLIYLLV